MINVLAAHDDDDDDDENRNAILRQIFLFDINPLLNDCKYCY